MRTAATELDGSKARKLLLWISGQLPGVRCTNLQDLSNGVIWCRLMTKLWPGSLASVLIINRPANPNDSQHNYILLESAFAKVSLQWMFETQRLIAGDSAELLRLAQAMVNVDNVFQKQLKMQRKIKHVANKLSRSSRILAGTMPAEQAANLIPTSSQHRNVLVASSSSPPPPPALQVSASAAMPVDGKEAAEAAAATAAADTVVQVPSNICSISTSTLGEAQRLRQEIRTMFHQQQSALEDYMAQQQQLLPSDGGHAYAALCLCPECVQKRQNPPVATETDADELPELHDVAHEAHEAQVAHNAPDAHK